MNTSRKKNWLTQLSSWYFSKQVLPYWCLLLLDAFIMFMSSVFVYWVQNRTMATFTHRDGVFLTSLMYALLSWVGARIFRTYSGVVRYSSSVDLLRIAYRHRGGSGGGHHAPMVTAHCGEVAL